mmetsp:Transcript_23267/g.54904  ORF Transcript_23267/g.54904 Transcript_23267/m.54904 type:complete len:206 (+) Transcript_23267:682-1299(+)
MRRVDAGEAPERREGRRASPSSRPAGHDAPATADEREPDPRDAGTAGPPPLPPPGERVQHDARVDPRGSQEGSLAGRERQTRGAVHRLRLLGGHVAPRPGPTPARREGHDVRRGAVHERTRRHRVPPQDGRHPKSRGPGEERRAAAQAGVRVLLEPGGPAREQGPQGAQKEVGADPGQRREEHARRGCLRVCAGSGGDARNGRAR